MNYYYLNGQPVGPFTEEQAAHLPGRAWPGHIRAAGRQLRVGEVEQSSGNGGGAGGARKNAHGRLPEVQGGYYRFFHACRMPALRG